MLPCTKVKFPTQITRAVRPPGWPHLGEPSPYVSASESVESRSPVSATSRDSGTVLVYLPVSECAYSKYAAFTIPVTRYCF